MLLKPNELTVVPHHGAPCIHVDGVPHHGLAFWHFPMERGISEWQLFARSGVHFFQLDLNCWSTDSADWEAALSHTLAADPEAKIWLRISTLPTKAWLESNPDHVQIHQDQNNGDEIKKSAVARSIGGLHLLQ